MTNPAYTHRSSAAPPLGESVRLEVGPRHVWPHRGLDRAVGRLLANPRTLQWLLDVLAIGFVGLAFINVGVSAEFLFHCVFVILVLNGFLFGLRGTLLRIGFASLPLLLYADATAFGLSEPSLELTEWPLMFVIAALVAWMADRLQSTSRRYAALFRHASERLLTVEEDERRRIAGELHDGVGQVLTAVGLTLDAATSEPDPLIARERTLSARVLTDTALAATRDLAGRIRPARIEERGLVPAVRDLADQTGFTVDVQADAAASGTLARLGSTATVELYRIVQEALANAARHSGAAQASVRVTCRDQDLVVVVADQGQGFDPGTLPESGIGLAGMHERARLLGGQLAIEIGRPCRDADHGLGAGGRGHGRLMAIRVGIVDDHALVRDGLKLILEAQPDIEVVGLASDGPGALQIAADHGPDLMLIDLMLDGADGISLVRDLTNRHPRIRLIAVTMHHDGETVRQAFLAGVAGYIVKGAASSDLIVAVRAVADNQHYVHPVIASVVVVDSLRWLRQGDHLSPREIEVLRLVTAGRTAVEAGRALGISAHTVRRHLSNVAAKIGVRGRVALTRYAIDHDLVYDEP